MPRYYVNNVELTVITISQPVVNHAPHLVINGIDLGRIIWSEQSFVDNGLEPHVEYWRYEVM